ncbi:MAG: M23 family metallopeptidase [Cyclobacteriaceae bacterium]|nr:M23 family metallopeptidase [Cyclobacteriaceae bacterium]
MAAAKFQYNNKTLRFEQVKISYFSVLLSVLSYLTFGLFFFVGLVLLQNFLIETPVEKRLRTENKALEKHKLLLTSQLTQSNQQLAELKSKDLTLYQKLFETKLAKESSPVYPEREQLLMAGAGDFNESIEQLGQRFSELLTAAQKTSRFYQARASVKKEDVGMLTSIPSTAPVENFEVSKLVSGFGIRINPFHKGQYHHDGVDIASPRNTRVLASAPGRVILTKRSDLIAGYGNFVEIDHGNGYVTRYGHLEEIIVRQGQVLKKGQILGSVGSSGGSIAPHLHYEVTLDGKNLDPVKFILEGISADQYKVLLSQSSKQNQSLD